MDKKKALFPRLTGKYKESNHNSLDPSSSSVQQNSNIQAASSAKSNSSTRSSRLFSFGKKMHPK